MQWREWGQVTKGGVLCRRWEAGVGWVETQVRYSLGLDWEVQREGCSWTKSDLPLSMVD
jgi:hypothetical protein